MTVPPEKFDNWAPVRVYWREDKPFVDWCYLDTERFTHPFFDNTIERRFRNHFSFLFRHQTPLDFLSELNDARPGLAPTGFIFHISRCGSTLAAQMLASLPQNIVISEAPAIDTILRLNLVNPAVTDEQRIKWLRGLIGALGRKRTAEESHYFIKFDSWSTLDLDMIARAFPDVPWVFLYRDPVEVIVSQMRQRGAQMIPGSLGHLLPDLNFHEALQMPAEEYCARVLGRFCESVIYKLQDGENGNVLLVNYRQLPEAVTSTILDHFGVRYSVEDIDKMKAAAHYDAKMPQVPFVSDSGAKREQASEAATKAAKGGLNFLYEKLESMRIAQMKKSAA
jgi:gluconate kinase